MTPEQIELARHACPACDRTFSEVNSLWQHAKAKHGQRVANTLRPLLRQHEQREPSMADLVVEAQIARACGEPVEDWIAEMFDV